MIFRLGALGIVWLLVAATIFAQATAAPPDLNAVVEMLEAGRTEEAERELRALLAERDRSAVRDLLGVVLGQQGRLDAAEREFRRAVELDPTLFRGWQHLGRLYLQQQRPDDAIAALRKAAELGSLERDLTLRLAALELSAGNPDRAERLFRSNVERFDSVAARLELARLQARRGQRAEAAESLRAAVARAPNSEEALSAFARHSLAAREPVPAIRALEALTRMYSAEFDYAYLLGVARLQIGENDGAVEALERALEIEPDRATALTALGLALNNRKQFAEARQTLARSLETQPDSVEGLAALAEADEGLGELEAAERHALRALEGAGTDHAGALLVIGKVRMSQRRYEEARDALLRAVSVDETSAKAHYQLSLAYARLGDSESSKRHLDLYREALRRAEEYLVELRTRAGLAISEAG